MGNNKQSMPPSPLKQTTLDKHRELTPKQMLLLRMLFVTMLIITAGLYFYSVNQEKPIPVEPEPTLAPTPVINVDEEKKRGRDTINYLRQVLGCQQTRDKKYPKSLFEINLDCFPKEVIPTPPKMAAELTSLNYYHTNQGKGYYFEMPVTQGQGYIVTRFNIEYITTPKDASIEKLAYARDATRIALLNNLTKALIDNKVGTAENPASLCYELTYPCFGNSRFLNSKKTDGSGWVKINFKLAGITSIPSLPIDSINNENTHFVYCANETGWEMNAAFETGKWIESAQNDGGDDARKFEVGTNLKLINNIPGCEFK